MKSITLCLLLIGFACTTNAQTFAEKITGSWTQSNSGDKRITWNFNADSTGSIQIFRRSGKVSCTVTVAFKWEPADAASSIRFSSGGDTRNCEIMGGGDAAGSYAKGMSDGYMNKSEVYEVRVEEKGMVVGGWRLER